MFIAKFLIVTAVQTRNLLSTDQQTAPPLTAATLYGEIYDLESARGRPALIYFFAPWCTYCAVSSANLVRLREWRDASELEIIVVALDWRSAKEVNAYATKHELNMPVVLGNAEIARDWQIYAFPTYYVLDSQHRIVKRDLGYSTQAGLWWRTWFADS